MTPEERFERIEKILLDLSASQSDFRETQKITDQQIRDTQKEIREMQQATDAYLRTIGEQIKSTQEFVLDAQIKTDEQIRGLIEAQKDTGEKLNILIAEIDRLIRHQGDNNKK